MRAIVTTLLRPGLAGMLCAVGGVYLLAGLAWALLAAAPFFLFLDWRAS